MRILLADEQRGIRFNKGKARSVAERTLKALGMPQDTLLAITFVTKGGIRKLNRAYFGKKSLTDVIALGYIASKGAIFQKRYIGDILICPSVVRDNANCYKVSFFSELSLCIIHGILHLLGYDDVKENDRLKMEEIENRILKKIL